MSINGLEELEGMRSAGAVVRLVLEAMKHEVPWGVTAAERYVFTWQVARPRFSKYCWW
jgi:methionine aminopeptidase